MTVTYNRVMRGGTIIRRALADYLSVQMPVMLEVARNQWDVSDWELPDPVVWDTYDPLMASAYPTVGSLIQRDSNWTQKDTNIAGEEVFRSIYTVQAFIWVMSPSEASGVVPEFPKERALQLRDDEFGIMRSCILGTPTLNSTYPLRVNVDTMSGDYLDPFQVSDQNPLWLAGATMTFDVELTEANYFPIAGIAETHDITATKIDEE